MKSKVKSIAKEKVNLMPFGNRVINQKQVSHLKREIKKHGINRVLVVVITNVFGEGMKYYIKDGQHLYLACLALGIEKELFMIIDQYTYKNVTEVVTGTASINADQKSWKLSDFVNAFAATNQTLDYNILANKFIKYGLSIQLTAMIYGGLSSISASKMIRSGEFKIIAETKGDKISKIIQDVVLVFGKTNYTFLRSFTAAFYKWFNAVNYNHKKFISFLENNKDSILLINGNEIEIFLQKYK